MRPAAILAFLVSEVTEAMVSPTLRGMNVEASVLLVAVGDPPVPLSKELERLGVRVITSGFSETEEILEEQAPDLVVLSGSRGAIELANLLEDQEESGRPRMVIVAERKELARLRGLNREIVISLFAVETTEKVVGQRIESLARRAARRRNKDEAPKPAAPQKTALGLPAAQPVARVALKRAAAPSPPRASTIAKPVEPESESESGAEAEQKTKNSATGTGGSDAASPSREAPKPPGTKKAENASPAQSPSGHESVESLVVADEDLYSIAPSVAPEQQASLPEIPKLEKLEGLSAVGEDAPVSVPPALPPSAKTKEEEAIDISNAEEALENLDSIKAEITPELLKSAQEAIHAEGDNQEALASHAKGPESLAADAIESIPPDALDSILPDAEEDGEDSGELDAGASKRENAEDLGQDQSATHEQDVEIAPVAAPLNPSPEAAKESSVADVPIAGDIAPKAPAMRTGSSSQLEESLLSSPADAQPPADLQDAPRVPQRKSSAGLYLGLGAVGLALGAIAHLVGFFDSAASAPQLSDEALVSAAKTAPSPPSSDGTNSALPTQKSDGAIAAPQVPAEVKSDTGLKNAPSAPAPAADVETPDPETSTPPAASDESKSEATPQLKAALSNPFKVEDTNQPSCDQLLSAASLEKDKDPIQQASQIWAEARKLIVSGKSKEANRKMCEAVALNPQSAAIEGLAIHYLSQKSMEQAMYWVDKAEEVRPGQSEMAYLRGDIHSLRGESEKALEIWLKTLNIRPDESVRIRGVSKDYSVDAGRSLRRGDLIRAERWFRRAVTLDPENLAGVVGLAKTFHRGDDSARAQAFCVLSLKVSDVIPEVHVLLGEIALREGSKAEARTRFERALAVRPGFYPAKRGLAQLAQ